jgi:hypothetical protein
MITFFGVHHLVNRDDRHLLAHAIASDFSVTWQSVMYLFWQLIGWATFWAIFSQTHLATLARRTTWADLCRAISSAASNVQENCDCFCAAIKVSKSLPQT